MRRLIFLCFLALIAVCGFWVGCFWLAQVFGFNSQVTPFYGFTSGPGPMVLTAIGMSTIIVGLWRNVNCHIDGCWNPGKHRIKGTPYCTVHESLGREQEDAEDLLREIRDELRELRKLASR